MVNSLSSKRFQVRFFSQKQNETRALTEISVSGFARASPYHWWLKKCIKKKKNTSFSWNYMYLTKVTIFSFFLLILSSFCPSSPPSLFPCLSFLNSFLMLVKSLSHVQLFVTPWTAAHQAPLSMGFSKQEYWSGVPLPSPKGWYFNIMSVKWWHNMCITSVEIFNKMCYF